MDPRLFQTQPKEEAVEEGAIEVLTSPAPKKKTKKARTAEEKAERKKVSHARKVSSSRSFTYEAG